MAKVSVLWYTYQKCVKLLSKVQEKVLEIYYVIYSLVRPLTLLLRFLYTDKAYSHSHVFGIS